MDLYFIFLTFCLVGTVYSSYSRFIKTATGHYKMKCNHDSVFITNHTKFMTCNGEESCWLLPISEKVSYVCLKKEFQKSNCKELTGDMVDEEYGCFVGNKHKKSVVYFPPYPMRMYDIFVLQNSIEFLHSGNRTSSCSALCPRRFCGNETLSDCNHFTMDVNAWILSRVNNDVIIDFEKFFFDPLPTPITDPTKTDKNGSSSIQVRANHSIVWFLSFCTIFLLLELNGKNTNDPQLI